MTGVIPCQEWGVVPKTEQPSQETREVTARLVQAIDQKGLTQTAVARVADVDQSTVSNWKKGKSFPTMDQLARLLPLLGKSGHFLLTGEDYPGDPDAANTAALRAEGASLILFELEGFIRERRARLETTVEPAAAARADRGDVTEALDQRRQIYDAARKRSHRDPPKR